MDINFDETDATWDAFASSSPQRSIFVRSAFLKSLGSDYALVTCYDGDRIVAGTPVMMGLDGRPLTSVHPFTQYQGLLLAPSRSGRRTASGTPQELSAVTCLAQALVSRFGGLCLEHSWRLEDLRALQWLNFGASDVGHFGFDLRYTAILDLLQFATFDDYLTSVRPVRRQEHRKAGRAFEIESTADESMLDALHEKTLERSGGSRSERDSGLVRSITRQALRSGYGSLRSVRIEEEAAAAVLFLYDDRSAYYMFGASDPRFRSSGASTFLILTLIREALEGGIAEVDFVGVNSPNRGDYKLSFGATLRPYFTTSFPAAANLA